VRSAADSIYDFLGWIKPSIGMPHDGMKFSTHDEDNDIYGAINCAAVLGGGFWHNKCGVFIPMINIGGWYNRGQEVYEFINTAHMMVKLQ